MRRTLRRSCAACAKAKHKCDLQMPRCSRCAERNYSTCVYANQPLASATSPITRVDSSKRFIAHKSQASELLTLSVRIGAQDLDPFDTYPSTSLPRIRVQGLIHHFLSKIAFQYYPLELNPSSNPFITSWWPLALADPALFHVSLQTACLDDELQAQTGFVHSQILMRDAVSLVRRKVQDPLLAFQDATMNAVITMAAIEHGMGNTEVSRIHVNAVKRMVAFRGGISNIRESSPLTARMVPWVSMLVMGSPQFQTQDNRGIGDGICSIPEWDSLGTATHPSGTLINLDELHLDPTILDVFLRLQILFRRHEEEWSSDILSTTTGLHDLTCFVLHRLLVSPSPGTNPTTISECVRYAISTLMFIIHGRTYYSHAAILRTLVLQLRDNLELIATSSGSQSPLLIWLLLVGMVGSVGTEAHPWFASQAAALSATLDLRSWSDVDRILRSILWLETNHHTMFRQLWEPMLALSSDVPVADSLHAAVPHD
ncbi:hypothetical protein LSUE1_G005236 [Lachnellula suecica]|uniref:Zn(2)-C6 fungal-type domain-containing protein n=1 Tax=Lachnellula suecica TaxID=602035 RepID=A0A8T9C086_9HELO|nr:hypothetical protein LSUE1_G005236 [Lachnellula suecica]